MAAGRRIVADCARRLRRISKHERVSGHRHADGAASAVVEKFERSKYGSQSADAGQWLCHGSGRHAEYIAVDEFPRRLRTELAVVDPARFARSVAINGDVSRNEGNALAARVLAEYVSFWIREPIGLRLSTSNGASTRNAAQIQLRRRLRNGFTASTQYTYARAFDNAPLMSGGIVTATQGGPAIAQNWLDLAPSARLPSFDQRHQVTIQAQYTTGVGVRGGAPLGGWKGLLFKEWTVASQLNAGSVCRRRQCISPPSAAPASREI